MRQLGFTRNRRFISKCVMKILKGLQIPNPICLNKNKRTFSLFNHNSRNIESINRRKLIWWVKFPTPKPQFNVCKMENVPLARKRVLAGFCYQMLAYKYIFSPSLWCMPTWFHKITTQHIPKYFTRKQSKSGRKSLSEGNQKSFTIL